jgi:hypothetical protein
VTFFTKLYGDWADLDVRVDFVESQNKVIITRVSVPCFGDHNMYMLLPRLTIERLKREARIALRRDGVRLMLTPDGEEAS